MNKIKKLFYYLFNDRKYIQSYLNYKIKSNQSILFIFFRYIFGLFKSKKTNNSNLLFIYDLELNPLTFNFGQHFANATIFSKKKIFKKNRSSNCKK